MTLTATSPGADDPRETAPSPLSRLHPGHATGLAEFLVFADWPPEMLDDFGGDPEFTSEVQAEMRRLSSRVAADQG
jgi:hypothetical protein